MLALAFLSTSILLSQLEFRRKLTQKLIHYSFLIITGGRTNRKRGLGLSESICGAEMMAPFATNWTGVKCEFLSFKYPQHFCKTVSCEKGCGPIVNA
jgi:hypothetical protein